MTEWCSRSINFTQPPAIGGPDVLPDEKSDQNIKLPVYQYMVSKYPTNMDRFCSMQRNSYSTLHEGTSINWTMHDLFQYSVNVYGCDYILWNIKESGPASEYTTTQDALPVINANPNF